MGCSHAEVWYYENQSDEIAHGGRERWVIREMSVKNMKEAIIPDIYERTRMDRIVTVNEREAFSCANRLAVEEGIFVGVSSGAALKVAEDFLPDDTVVTLPPDRGDRHISTNLFRLVWAECPP